MRMGGSLRGMVLRVRWCCECAGFFARPRSRTRRARSCVALDGAGAQAGVGRLAGLRLRPSARRAAPY